MGTKTRYETVNVKSNYFQTLLFMPAKYFYTACPLSISVICRDIKMKCVNKVTSDNLVSGIIHANGKLKSTQVIV